MLTTDSTAVGLIRVEPTLREIAQYDAWDDSTLDTLLASYAHYVPADEGSLPEPSSSHLVTLARVSRVVASDSVQTVVRANRAQLLLDLEAEYLRIGGRLEG